MRVYNFAAGPSALPLEVLKVAQNELTNFNGSGMSIMECTHRGKIYEPVHSECISLLRSLLGVSDNYEVLLLQGGASLQFDSVPLNLLKTGKADYVVTGNFAKKAYEAAQKYGDIRLAGSTQEDNFNRIPEQSELTLSSDCDYLHITYNNTIFGTKWHYLPQTTAPIVTDISSAIMSEAVNIDDFGLLYAGAQKNLGPAGVTVVIVRKDLIGHHMSNCPTMLRYSLHAKNNSLYNTPPTFAIYMMMLYLRHIEKNGGVSALEAINRKKAKLLYDYLDDSSFFTNSTKKEHRSLMNVTFVSPSAELDAKFVQEAQDNGLYNLKGHRVVGGMRASIYNAMTYEGVSKLVDFMKNFELQNK